jgi:integrase
MAITEINNEQGMKQFSVYVNIRSSSMPHIRLQKRIKGLDSKAEAMRKERALIKELSSKVAQREGHGLTWRMIVLRWAETVSEEGYQYKSYNPATIKDHVSMMLTWTSDWLDRPASKITRGEGRQVLDSILNEDRSKSFQKKVKNTINMIYNWAIEERFIRGIHNSPVHGLRIVIKEDKRPEILKKDEIRKLLFEGKARDHKWYHIWAVALLSGMRNGELYALKWADIDFENRMITVQRAYNRRFNTFKSTKAGYWRSVPISEELKSVLLELKSNLKDDFVLPRISLWKIGQQAKVLKEFCKSIGLPEIKFHTLRACFATQLIGSGIEPIKVMKICGWKDLKTMAYYLRLSGIDERGATEGLSFLPSLGGNIVSIMK